MKLFAIDQGGSTFAPTEDAPPAVADVIEATVDLYRRKGYMPPWIGYIGVEDGACVGGCGFAGPPDGGEVEIAYFTFPGHEGKGVATRMAIALMQRAPGGADGTITYVAHTLPQEGPSTSILRRLGFVLVAEIDHPEDGPVWKWRRPRSEESAMDT